MIWHAISLASRIIAFCRYRVKSSSYAYIDLSSTFEGSNIVLSSSSVFHSQVGRYTYIANNSRIAYAKIGRYSSIGSNVKTYMGQHPKSFVSTHPLFYTNKYSKKLGFDPTTSLELFAPHTFLSPSNKFVVSIGSDVWIGDNVTIMDGLRIGHGSVVAAGAVVTKDVEAYSIVAGIPAKIISRRFPESVQRNLLKSRWWEKDHSWISKRAHLFNSPTAFLFSIDNP